MIKVSRLADYAVVILAALNGQGVLAASELAEKTHLPEPTVSKVLKLLTKSKIIDSIRGAGGGYTLNRTPETVTVADIIRAVDGPISLTACVEGSVENCAYSNQCSIRGRWNDVNTVINNALAAVSLANMVHNVELDK